MRQETKEKLKALMDRAVAHHELAGGCLLVRQHNEEVCCLEAGMADVESGKPIQRDQIYRLYSMSKPIAGAAAMKLMEDGLLDLAQPVSEYLPSFENPMVEQDGRLVCADRPVQVRDLLNMTSGLVYNGDAGLAGKHADAVFAEQERRLGTDHPMTTMELASRLGEGPLGRGSHPSGVPAATHCPAPIQWKISKANRAASSQASHLALMGTMKETRNWASG